MDRLRLPICAALLSAVPLLSSTSLAQDPADAIADEITVFESRVTADLSALGARSVRRLRPQDLSVLEDGIPRRVTELRRLRSVGDWRIVLYFDAPLARARTMRLAGLQLGEYAEYLTGLGGGRGDRRGPVAAHGLRAGPQRQAARAYAR